jgi:hypothetical protein
MGKVLTYDELVQALSGMFLTCRYPENWSVLTTPVQEQFVADYICESFEDVPAYDIIEMVANHAQYLTMLMKDKNNG